mmetsp:Transcript_39276/g.111187  ORF Transcript_39276/g.111187 Transcript_39276/m.111187 type:complete len:226 (-) Transcript_39276:718-1395(-)
MRFRGLQLTGRGGLAEAAACHSRSPPPRCLPPRQPQEQLPVLKEPVSEAGPHQGHVGPPAALPRRLPGPSAEGSGPAVCMSPPRPGKRQPQKNGDGASLQPPPPILPTLPHRWRLPPPPPSPPRGRLKTTHLPLLPYPHPPQRGPLLSGQPTKPRTPLPMTPPDPPQHHASPLLPPPLQSQPTATRLPSEAPPLPPQTHLAPPPPLPPPPPQPTLPAHLLPQAQQ